MSKSAKKRHVACEPLEVRRMFITYQVDGTGGADTISVSIDGNSIISVVNGVSDSASDTINNNIEISGLGGNDIISIIETGANTITINSGSGDDTINIGNGNNDLDFIDDLITVNGEGNTDTVVLFNQSDTSGSAFTLSSGNQYTRAGVPAITANTENVTIHTSTSVSESFAINEPPSANVTINGSATQFNAITLHGGGSLSGTYRPDDVVTDKGTITFSTATINFTQCDELAFATFSNATLITPNPNDIVTLSGSGSSQVSGSSGGVTWAPMFAVSSSLTLDLATEDGGAGNDTITGAVGHPGVGTLRVNAGTGNNSLNANGGTWSVTTALGVGGVNLDVIANLATVSFAGFQHLRRLQLDNGGTANFPGAGPGTVLTTDTLAVNTGTGRISVGTGLITNATAFSIASGRALEKTGNGTLNINGAQSHGAGASLSVNSGVLNMFTDAGSAAARTLLVSSTGTTNFSATQHLAAVSADGTSGKVNMVANGNRVLVTGALAVSSESTAINLNDNDLILDYTNVADDTAARALLHNGRANGTWNGVGINSNSAQTNQQHNTTLGSLEATEFKSIYGPNATFDGQQLDNTMLLIKYTWYGDTDFNGIVDFDDYSRADAGFNNGRTGWLNGDFDDNGIVDFDDYSLIDQAFNTQGGTLRPGRSAPGWGIARILPEIIDVRA